VFSGGLKDTGSTSGGCRLKDRGQVYVRTKTVNGKFGIMYAWYWPKDHPVAGDLVSGHRHDWETCVVWLTSSRSNAKLHGAACSSHSGWRKSKNPKRNGNRIKVEYFTSGGKNHELQFSNTQGKGFPIYDWDRMPAVVKNALNKGNFKDAIVPFKDTGDTFGKKMRAAQV
jgi:hypothetical protein